jgi:octaheme c-type cytochrome (tetrathionate reductase family)
MKKILIALSITAIVVLITVIMLLPRNTQEPALEVLTKKYAKQDSSSVDHTKFAVLHQKFSTPQEVTEACISCHNGRDKEVMRSSHWNWEREEYIKGRGIVYIGKRNAINNFCIGVEGNEPSCAKCHIGFGMTDKMFSFTDAKNIDCLVCHDNTETYAKADEKSGYPDPQVDLNNVAEHVGKPKRTNCGVCHFYGGGGNNVKHGDLEESMFAPAKDVDVHMATDGVNLQCVSCHITKKHVMLGRVYSLSSMNKDRSTCEECHTEKPHSESILNEHTLKVACQTCHIPVYAKVNATKLEWDWTTAGKLKNGEPYEEDDQDGNHAYMSIKGSFKWGKNLKPDYVWFNGTAEHYLLGDVIEDTTKILVLNQLEGSYSDRNSKIIPVKIHKAKQPFDPVTKMLIQPKLFADKSGEGAFWKDFDWVRASQAGMKEVNLPFSGRVSFIYTEMFWPVNHMVSSKDKTVQCTECHTRNGSRLAGLRDFYMPGRDYNIYVERIGVGLLLFTFIGVIIHGSLRIAASKKNKRKINNGK